MVLSAPLIALARPGSGASVAVIAPDADAELLATCAAFWEEDRIVAAWDAGRIAAETAEPAHDRWWVRLRETGTMVPVTLTGFQAKAAVALRGIEAVADSEHEAEDVARGLLREVATWNLSAAGAGAVGVPPSRPAVPHPDAALIERCNFLVAWESRFIETLKFWGGRGDSPEGEAVIDALYAERDAALAEIDRLPAARTVAGITAIARALLAAAPRDLDGSITIHDSDQWLSYEIAEALVALADGGRPFRWPLPTHQDGKLGPVTPADNPPIPRKPEAASWMA
jgi:hypothetical protein